MKKSSNVYALKVILIFQAIGLGIYTYFTMRNDGIDFLSTGLSYIQAINWSGQFTLDFLCYLLLAALWIVWRGNFSGRSIATALVVSSLGILAFAPFVLYLVTKEKGDIRRVLVGDR